MLYGVLADLKTPEEIKLVMGDLLSQAEGMALLKRLGIALYLDKGRSYEDIKNNIKVSSATIASVGESLGNPGWQEMIRRVKAEEWAVGWTNEISRKVKNILSLRNLG